MTHPSNWIRGLLLVLFTVFAFPLQPTAFAQSPEPVEEAAVEEAPAAGEQTPPANGDPDPTEAQPPGEAPAEKEVQEIPAPGVGVVDEAAEAPTEGSAFDRFDKQFGKWVVGPLASVIMYDLLSFDNDTGNALKLPVIVAWLVLGALFFTVRMAFVNIRAFGHAIRVTKGDFDDPDDPGEISHFQALSSALSATVGLGNISGVAIAITLGGPGAIVWMIIAGALGMSSKFTEVTLGQMFRKIDANGVVSGGPMYYLRDGVGGPLGIALSGLFALMCIGGSFGGGNMFQSNQSYAALEKVAPSVFGASGAIPAWMYGLVMAALVAVVILGGIKRIGAAAGVLVPFMCGVYVLASLFVIFSNITAVPAAFGTMISQAFATESAFGGIVGALVVGFQRASFSNEAGVGSASIAHSAAATDEPVREGIVALLEPFIDTLVVCTMTGLVVVITGVYETSADDGVALTAEAFGSVIPWFPYVLAVAVVLFAFSTMISWSYYGEQAAIFLFGERIRIPYKATFVAFAFIGAVLKLGNVLDFSDLMILGMAGPNILGCILLSGKVKDALDDYLGRLKAGRFERSSR